MDGRLWAAVVIMLVASAVAVYTVARLLSPIGTTGGEVSTPPQTQGATHGVNTSVVPAKPETSGAQGAQQGGSTTTTVQSPSTAATGAGREEAEGAGEEATVSVEWGIVAQEVKRLFESISRGSQTGAPILPLETVKSTSVSIEAVEEPGVDVLVPGVVEPDDFVYAAGLLYVARGDRVYVINASTGSVVCAANVSDALSRLSPRMTLAIGGRVYRIPLAAATTKLGIVPLKEGFIAVASCRLRAKPQPLTPSILYTSFTVAAVYDAECRLERVYWVPGELSEARYAPPILWLVTVSYTPLPPLKPPAQAVAGNTPPYTTIAAVNLTSGEVRATILGGAYPAAAVAYPDDRLYLIASKPLYHILPLRVERGVQPEPRKPQPLPIQPSSPKTIVALAIYANDTLRIEAAVALNGTPAPEEFAVARKGDTLTVTLGLPGGGFTLYNLDADTLRIVGSVTVEEPGERIRAVRILGNRVLIVTYRSVDPLFLIDNSDPEKPRIVGFVKSPGFEDYLRPLNETVILGIGYDEKMNVRISLYKLVDDKEVVLTARIVAHGYVYSKASGKHGYRDIIVYNDTLLLPALSVEKGWKILVVNLDGLKLRATLPGYDAATSTKAIYTVEEKHGALTVRAYSAKTLKEMWETRLQQAR